MFVVSYLDHQVEGDVRSALDCYLNFDISLSLTVAGFKVADNKYSILVTNRMFGSVELFGRTSTVRFGPN